MDLVKLAKRMKELRDGIEALKAQQTELQKEYDKLRNDILPDAMDEAEQPTLVVKDVGKVILFPMFSVKQPKGDKTKLFTWLKKRRAGDLIVPTVNSSTLGAYIKEQIKDGKLTLEQANKILEVSAWTQARLTK